MTLYIVQGQSMSGGSHYDYVWNIISYTERDQAELHLAQLKAWLEDKVERTKAATEVGEYHYFDQLVKQEGISPFDAEHNYVDFDSVYRIVEVPFYLHIDQYREEKGL